MTDETKSMNKATRDLLAEGGTFALYAALIALYLYL